MEKLIESILRRIEADMNSPRIFEFLSLSLSPRSFRSRFVDDEIKRCPERAIYLPLSLSLSLSIVY